jgi:hypothetical protein
MVSPERVMLTAPPADKYPLDNRKMMEDDVNEKTTQIEGARKNLEKKEELKSSGYGIHS